MPQRKPQGLCTKYLGRSMAGAIAGLAGVTCPLYLNWLWYLSNYEDIDVGGMVFTTPEALYCIASLSLASLLLWWESHTDLEGDAGSLAGLLATASGLWGFFAIMTYGWFVTDLKALRGTLTLHDNVAFLSYIALFFSVVMYGFIVGHLRRVKDLRKYGPH